MNFKKILLACILGCLPVCAIAGSWWNGDWKFRKEVSFDLSPTGADITGTVQQVPVLVRLSLANFNYFSDAKPDGSDFRVVAGDDKTPLKFHFERYDSQNQMAYLWISLPALAGGGKSDKVFVYYGNSAATDGGDGAGTYDANQSLVLDFSQAGGLPADITAYKNNPSSSTAEIVSASLVGGGAKFSGGQDLVVAASPSLRLLPSQGFTSAAWVKIDSPQAQANVISLAEGTRELTLGIDGLRAFARYSGGSAPAAVAQSGADLSPGSWHHLALTAAGGQVSIYVDGQLAGQAQASLQEIGGELNVGGTTGAGRFLSGEVDEVSVSKVARSADWIKAVARSEGPESPLVVYGADGQKDSGGQGSYFVTIAKNLTVDGWVIIVICLSMLLAAIVIMFLKAMYLGKIEKSNGKFLKDFHLMSSNVDALDQSSDEDDDAFGDEAPGLSTLAGDSGKYGPSTLYRLYHIGIAEVHKRVPGRAAGAQAVTVLSSQAIEAIRASMDATLTRLGQTMSSQMVLLTIAISGGPFLGLLGTVVGVMITFAAIALSGDVNINAIAPGTAAALAATVAGLAVAIPCLFGYNWLNTRIKAINANNRVFLDEFVARIAEQYS
jgi:biopolymer transport protein ExbB